VALEQVYKPSELKLQFIYTFYYDFVIFADTSSYVVCKTNVSGRQHALECDVRWQRTTFFCAGNDGYMFCVLVWGRKFQGTNVSGNESSRERKFHLWYFCSWEQKYVGMKVP